MLSNLIAQLKEQNSLNKLEDVLSEVPRVREDLGYPPLVTPMSQMVGTQAAMNILSGERYKIVLKEVKSYIRGEYGKAPGRINPELVKKILGDEKPMEGRFADTLEPVFESTREKVKEFAESDEDILSYLLFPAVAEPFLKKRIESKNEPKKITISYEIKAV
jgi:oxaloacetate decarboxylase alpha subunit